VKQEKIAPQPVKKYTPENDRTVKELKLNTCKRKREFRFSVFHSGFQGNQLDMSLGEKLSNEPSQWGAVFKTAFKPHII